MGLFGKAHKVLRFQGKREYILDMKMALDARQANLEVNNMVYPSWKRHRSSWFPYILLYKSSLIPESYRSSIHNTLYMAINNVNLSTMHTLDYWVENIGNAKCMLIIRLKIDYNNINIINNFIHQICTIWCVNYSLD